MTTVDDPITPEAMAIEPEMLDLLRRIAAKPVYFMAPSHAEWELIKRMGTMGLLSWPMGEVLISVSGRGRKLLERSQ